jgi:pimeloyl-ACP methyl ester carboxylesterase
LAYVTSLSLREKCWATLKPNTDTLREDYLEALPKGTPKGTIVLIHGFPDISLGWRYQIPYLVELGYRTIALDCMGYGKTVS